ncbi:MFS transporter [Salinibacterium sp. G-O1]|uniref:MFS transporter n=1 Tax=Salinibacterium sp. G-O1 TaxID=3046208 RepID=UPI0024BA08AA|nr:MFS transporter [Salinibacterium sp. G-O1]MDJ0333983.1 MFS transporter [Salinibacterium sp. G-O1]
MNNRTEGSNMPHPRPLPLWAGRTISLLGILLVALNLRTAVSAISPITRDIAADIPLDNVALGLLGMVPPMAFAISALASAGIARKLGLEVFLVVAIALMIAGHLLRAAAPGYGILLVGSVLALVGMGIGNVLLPPLVKRYFPDRIGTVTALYATLASASAALPALVAVPVAHATDWRVSLGMWSILAFASLVPWAILLVQRSHEKASSKVDGVAEIAQPLSLGGRPIWRSGVAWTIAVVFAMSSFNVYGVLTWLPDILAQTAETSAAQSGALLALYAAMGLPAALLIPVLAARIHNIGPLVQLGALFFIIGDLGLLFAPGFATVLWVIFIGLGALIFPVCLVLINLRSRTMNGAVALSGFVQGVGYSIASLGPLLFGVLREATGGWVAVFVMLIVSAVVISAGGVLLRRPVFVEDQLQPERQQAAAR